MSLTIYCFGTPQFRMDGRPLVGLESDKIRALLLYLAANTGQSYDRGRLAGFLWPDYPEARARHNLRQALCNLRQAIGDRERTLPAGHAPSRGVERGERLLA